MRITRVFVGLLILVAAFSVLVHAALAGDVIIVPTPDGEESPIELVMPAGEDSGTYSLFLRNTTTETLENIQLFATLQDEFGRVKSDITLDFLTPGSDTPPDSFTLPAGGSVRVLLRIANLQPSGVYTGSITMQQIVEETAVSSAEVVTGTLETGAVTGTLGVGVVEGGVVTSTLETAVSAILAPLTVQRLPAYEIKVEQAADDKTVTFNTRQSAFTDLQLTLTESKGEADINNLQISLTSPIRSDGTQDDPGELTWHSDADKCGSEEPPDKLEIPQGRSKTITLCGALPEVTSYAATMSISYDGDHYDVYQLTLTRLDPTAITIQPATAEGNLAFTAASESFERVITLITAEGQPVIDDLQISLTLDDSQDGSIDLAGVSLACDKCDDNLYTLAPGEPLTVTITGSGLTPTTYNGTLFLSYQGTSKPVSLAVTRSARQDNLTVASPAPAIVTSYWELKDPTEAVIDVVVRNTAEQETAVYYPQLGPLQIVDENGNPASGVSEDMITLYAQDETGQFTRPVTGTELISGTVSIPAGKFEQFLYRIGGLSGAGKYTGQVEINGPNSQAKSQNLTIQVKHSWGLALLPIALGVLLSYGFFSWSRGGRQRALRNYDIARLTQLIRADYDPEQPPKDPVWDELLKRLMSLYNRNNDLKAFADSAGAGKFTTEATDIESRINLYRRGSALHAAIEKKLATYNGSNKKVLQDQLGVLFDKLRSALLKPTGQGIGSGNDDAEAQITGFKNLDKKIRQVMITEPAKKIQKDLQNLQQESPELLVNVQPVLQEVNNIITDANADKLDGLAERLATVQASALDLRFQQLDAFIDKLKRQRPDEKTNPDMAAAWDEKVEPWLDNALAHFAEGQAVLANDVKAAQESWRDGDHCILRARIEYLDIIGKNVSEVRGLLEKARTKWEEDAFGQAEIFLEEAEEAYLLAEVKSLAKRIDDTGKILGERPSIETDENWNKLLAEASRKQLFDSLNALKGEVDKLISAPPPDLRQQYSARREALLRLQKQGLDIALAYLMQKLTVSDTPNWKEALEKRMPDFTKRVQEVGTAVAQFDQNKGDLGLLQAVETAASAALAEYKAILQELQTVMAGGRTMGAKEFEDVRVNAGITVGTTGAAMGALPGKPQIEPVPTAEDIVAATDQEEFTMSYWVERIRGWDKITLVIAFIVAIVGGLVFLWLTPSTWGTASDYITAFLWGFGVSATSTQLQNGFVSFASETLSIMPKTN